MNEEDAQTAALHEYFDSNTPAGYGAAFRAGWGAGKEWTENTWEALAREKNWGYVHDERMDAMIAQRAERDRIMTKMLDEIDNALSPLLGLTKAEMKIDGVVRWARNTLEAE